MSDIKQLNICSSKYPKALKNLPDAPEVLYYRGNLDVLDAKPKIAVVGTRRCSQYGIKATEKIAGGLANAGVCIVSGLARGIDTYGHKAALDFEAPTIAVTGSGIDDKTIYPQKNRGLANDIVEAGGLILSEYSPGTPGNRHRFPERNRIVAMLSDGVLAVEAPLKSGTLITTRLAGEYKKKVYAVPGSVFSRLSAGTNNLIHKGAKIVRSADDILKEFEVNSKINLGEKNKNTNSLNKEEALVFNFINKAPEAVHVDKIIQSTKLSSDRVYEIIAGLMLQDYIKETDSNHYICQN